MESQPAGAGGSAQPADAGDRPVRGAAQPQQLQLPRRGVGSGGPDRGGGPARADRVGDHRPRRSVRRRPVRRGGAGLRPRHHLRRRAVAGAADPAERRRRPGGFAPAGAGSGGRGLPPAGRGDHRGAAARRREGPPALRPGRARGRRGRALDDPDRVPQGSRTPGSRRRRTGGRGPGAGPADGPVRSRPGGGRAGRPRPPRRLDDQRPAGGAGPGARPAGGGHQRGALRPAAAVPPGQRDGRGPGPAQPAGDGRLAAGAGGAPAVGGGDGPDLRPLPGGDRADRGRGARSAPST